MTGWIDYRDPHALRIYVEPETPARTGTGSESTDDAHCASLSQVTALQEGDEEHPDARVAGIVVILNPVCTTDDSLTCDTSRLDSTTSRRRVLSMKKVLLWGVVAFLVFFIATQPQNAAALIEGIAGGLNAVAVGLGTVLGRLAT